MLKRDELIRLAVGVVASGLLHLAAVMALWFSGALQAQPATPWRSSPLPEPKAPAPPPRLGLERSQATTINWIGYEEYQRHEAARADQEQPALSPNPSEAAPPELAPPLEQSAAAAGTPGQASSAVSVGLAESSPTQAVQAAGAGETGEAEASASPSAPIAPGPDPFTAETADALARLLMEIGDRLMQAAQQAVGSTPQAAAPANADARKTTEQVVQGDDGKEGESKAPSPAALPPTEAAPGQASEKEADPFALTEPVRVTPGRPLAMKGLEIVTVAPRFSVFTRMTSGPRRTLVETQFDRSGRVRRAKATRSSGNANIDGPVLDAVYRWTAKGEALQRLGEDDTLTITFEIVLR